MAYEDPLPDGNQVTRGCSRGYDQGQVTASAFDMRPQDEELLQISVDWVECSHAPQDERDLPGSVRRMAAPPSVRPPYAVLGVTEIRQIKRNSCALNAQEFGTTNNQCHCVISGFTGTHVDLELQNALAEVANASNVLCAPDDEEV